MKELTYEKALHRSASLCSSGEHFSDEIHKKLLKWGISPSEANRINDYLIDEKYIDNHRFARAYCLDKLRYNHWGRVKIQQMLRMQGLEEDAIRYGLLQINDDEYLHIMDDVIAQKSRSLSNSNEKNDYQRKVKIVKHLLSRGFEMGIIVKRLDFSNPD